MEAVTLIAAVIGILVGAIALAEKLWGILPRRTRLRKKFEKQFRAWEDSGHSSLPSHEVFRAIVGVALKDDLTDEQQGFALLTALQHGDRTMHELIRRNASNEVMARSVMTFLAGRGVRVGWRAEYALSQFSPEIVEPLLKALLQSQRASAPVREAVKRVLESSVVEYLEAQARGEDSKYRTYAREVLAQIGSDIPES